MCVGIAWHRFSWDEKFEREREREGEKGRTRETDRWTDTGEKGKKRHARTSFYNLISGMTSHHFCHILFTRSNPHAQGRDHTWAWVPRGGVAGGIFEAAYHSSVT